MNGKVVIIHRRAGSSKKDWYPWLEQELKQRNFEVVIPEMPNSHIPKINEWVEVLSKQIISGSCL